MRKDLVKKLAEKQAQTVIQATAELKFQDKIELSSQSPEVTGLAKQIGKTKSGNFSYVLTTEKGSFKFYSKEELDTNEVEDHSFGIQKLDDGKELYWY